MVLKNLIIILLDFFMYILKTILHHVSITVLYNVPVGIRRVFKNIFFLFVFNIVKNNIYCKCIFCNSSTPFGPGLIKLNK